MDAYEREEEDICRRENEGIITHKEAQTELRELQRDYRGAAEEAAENAYREELERW
jgi:hypothetical protein